MNAAAVLLDGAAILSLAAIVVRQCPHYVTLRKRGWEHDDLVQEVCLSVLTKQRGRSAYDPTRATQRDYVRMLAWSRMGHLLDRIEQPRAPGGKPLGEQLTWYQPTGDKEMEDRAHTVPMTWAKPHGWTAANGSTVRRRKRLACAQGGTDA